MPHLPLLPGRRHRGGEQGAADDEESRHQDQREHLQLADPGPQRGGRHGPGPRHAQGDEAVGPPALPGDLPHPRLRLRQAGRLAGGREGHVREPGPGGRLRRWRLPGAGVRDERGRAQGAHRQAAGPDPPRDRGLQQHGEPPGGQTRQRRPRRRGVQPGAVHRGPELRGGRPHGQRGVPPTDR